MFKKEELIHYLQAIYHIEAIELKVGRNNKIYKSKLHLIPSRYQKISYELRNYYIQTLVKSKEKKFLGNKSQELEV